jgi:hypothetical protein
MLFLPQLAVALQGGVTIELKLCPQGSPLLDSGADDGSASGLGLGGELSGFSSSPQVALYGWQRDAEDPYELSPHSAFHSGCAGAR